MIRQRGNKTAGYWPRAAIFLYLVAQCLMGCQAPEEPTERPPNVLLIISDDQAYTDYGFMGHPEIETPRLDALAEQSLTFTRGYVTAPLCSPSLASLITGLYAYQHGITGNDPSFDFEGQRYGDEWRRTRIPFYDTLKQRFYSNKLLTEYLGDQGYRSLQTGKWWLGSWKEGHFDAGMTHGDPSRGGRHGDDGLVIGREGLQPIYDFVKESQAEDAPFFIWYAPFLPHAPHTPPDTLLEKYMLRTDSEALARYYAMCEWFDETCGALIDFLRAEGLDEETLVIYTSDNGWIQRPDAINRYAPRSKRSPYEGGIRTPLMLHWPGTIDAKLDSQTQVSNIDIVPTILSACDIKYDKLPGINLLNTQVREDRKTIFAEVFDHDIADVQEPNKSLQYRIALQYPWKLILPNLDYLEEGTTELYDLSKDKSEMTNLAAQEVDHVEALTKLLNDWWAGPQ